MIPVKYNIHGDRQEGEALRGQARRVVAILDNIVRTGGLNDKTIRFTPYDGSHIVAHSFFGQTVVDIYAGVPAPTPPPEEPKICICNCNLSEGWILEIQDGELINGAQLYTVMACNLLGTAYIPYRNILASDWTKYEVGQKVLLVPYNQMAYLCCTDKTGGDPIVRGCQPIESAAETEDNAWRTTYRILPWCALLVPVLVDPTTWNPYG